MGRAKGGKNRAWTSKEKYEVIDHVINGNVSSEERAKSLSIASGMIRNL